MFTYLLVRLVSILCDVPPKNHHDAKLVVIYIQQKSPITPNPRFVPFLMQIKNVIAGSLVVAAVSAAPIAQPQGQDLSFLADSGFWSLAATLASAMSKFLDTGKTTGPESSKAVANGTSTASQGAGAPARGPGLIGSLINGVTSIFTGGQGIGGVLNSIL